MTTNEKKKNSNKNAKVNVQNLSWVGPAKESTPLPMETEHNPSACITRKGVGLAVGSGVAVGSCVVMDRAYYRSGTPRRRHP